MKFYRIKFSNGPSERLLIIDDDKACLQITLQCIDCRICAERMYETEHFGVAFTIGECGKALFRNLNTTDFSTIADSLFFWNLQQIAELHTTSTEQAMQMVNYVSSPDQITVVW